MKKKLLHVGLCVQPEPFNGFQTQFIDILGAENYREISTGDVRVNEKIIEIVNEFKPDIIFFQIQAENIIRLATFLFCKKSGAFVINWTGDKRATVPAWIIDCAHLVSLTAFSNMDDVIAMRNMGFKSDYLEIGYNPLIYIPDGPRAENVPDVVFMGNNYGRDCFQMSGFRIDMVDFLKSEFKERFGVYGTGWAYANGNANASQMDEAALYRGAKIAINVSHFDSLNYNSDRLLRILGSGVACVSFNHRGMYETYGDAVDYFNTFIQLKDKINFYLENGYNRYNLAARGNEFVKNNFTFKHQVENIIKLAEL